jgi:hypothetical protein
LSSLQLEASAVANFSLAFSPARLAHGTGMLKASTGSSRSTACSASPTYGVVEAAGCFYLPPVQMRGQAKSFSLRPVHMDEGNF